MHCAARLGRCIRRSTGRIRNAPWCVNICSACAALPLNEERARRLPPPPRAQLVELLVQCHDEKPYAKFWGACNDPKVAMDDCFRAEKEEKRRANFEKTKAFNAERSRKHAEAASNR